MVGKKILKLGIYLAVSKEDKEEGFYRRLEDRHDIDTGLYEVRPAHYVWVYNPKRKGGTAANYGLSAVRGDYREPEEDNRVNTEYNAILDRPERKACRGGFFLIRVDIVHIVSVVGIYGYIVSII